MVLEGPPRVEAVGVFQQALHRVEALSDVRRGTHVHVVDVDGREGDTRPILEDLHTHMYVYECICIYVCICVCIHMYVYECICRMNETSVVSVLNFVACDGEYMYNTICSIL